MTQQEQKEKIEEIYNDAIEKIEDLEKKRKQIINDYIKELENKKIEAIKNSLSS